MKTIILNVSYDGDAKTWDEIKNDAENEKITHVFIGKKEFVNVVCCNECKHLKIVNKKPVYAQCELGRKMFMLFDVDAREWFCADGERKNE